tara:strand:+ start:1347 stop:1667 length:321 start_codon:yes stop_codon:yes gene_type:complete
MNKFNKKQELKLIKKIVEEESIDAFISYNAEYEFKEFNNDVKTVYVWENHTSQNSVEYHMLDKLIERIKEINPRYRVGIMFEEKNPDAEEFDEIRQSYLQSDLKDF